MKVTIDLPDEVTFKCHNVVYTVNLSKMPKEQLDHIILAGMVKKLMALEMGAYLGELARNGKRKKRS